MSVPFRPPLPVADVFLKLPVPVRRVVSRVFYRLKCAFITRTWIGHSMGQEVYFFVPMTIIGKGPIAIYVQVNAHTVRTTGVPGEPTLKIYR